MSIGLSVAYALQVGVTLTPIDGPELAELFREVSVVREGVVNVAEFFRMDGTYSLQGRVKENGQFWIAGAEICVQVERTIEISSYCRGFARGSDNQIYLVSTGRDGESRQIDPVKLSFASL